MNNIDPLMSDEYTARALERHRQKKQAARHVVEKLGLPPDAEFDVYDVMYNTEDSLKKVLSEAAEEVEEVATEQSAFTHTSPPIVVDADAHEVIERYMRDIARRFHSEPAKQPPSFQQEWADYVYQLYKRSGVHLDRFLNLLSDAEQESMRKISVYIDGERYHFKTKVRIQDFFLVLERKLEHLEEPWKQADTSTKAEFDKDARTRRKQK